MQHIYSELAEADNELFLRRINQRNDRLAEELVDLQMSCETMLTCMGLNADQRNEVRRKVVEKNRVRGYYEPL